MSERDKIKTVLKWQVSEESNNDEFYTLDDILERLTTEEMGRLLYDFNKYKLKQL